MTPERTKITVGQIKVSRTMKPTGKKKKLPLQNHIAKKTQIPIKSKRNAKKETQGKALKRVRIQYEQPILTPMETLKDKQPEPQIAKQSYCLIVSNFIFRDV